MKQAQGTTAMEVAKMRVGKKSVSLAALVVVLAVCAGCDPGWVNPVAGSGDRSGSVPDGRTGVEADAVALGSPTALVDLGARGYLVYDADNCTIVSVAHGEAIRYAGNGTCGSDGDGGPAVDAKIDLVVSPLAIGLQTDPDGNVYFVSAPDGQLRRIDAATGVITTVAALVGTTIYGLAPEAGGRLVYATVVDDDSAGVGDAVQIRRLDHTGADTLIASLPSAARAGGFARVGSDHYVLPGVVDGEPARLDVDHGTVTTTPVTSGDVLIYEAAGSDGSVYGITWTAADGLDGNHVFRMRPDGSVDFVAGSGVADPGTGRQMGSGLTLDLSATAIAMTRHGNLLISSGHTVYDLLGSAQAPPIA